MVLRRTTFYGVIACEGCIRIASHSSDRPGPNTRRDAASEIEVYREARSHVAIDELNIGHAAANIAGQGQIARLN